MMDITRLAVCVSSMMNIYEHLHYFPEEVLYIWSTIHDFSLLKACFIIARYFIFVLHYINFVIGDMPEYLDPSLASHRQLEDWIFVKNCCFQVLVWTVDYPAIRRVYLLYNRPRWAYRFFCCIGLLKFTNDVYFAVRVRRDRQANVYPTSRVPDHLLWLFTGPELMLHTILFGFAMQAGRVSNQLRTPVTTRLRVNGSEVLVMAMLTVMAVIMYIYIDDFTPFLFPFTTMAWSAVAGRLILSMHRVFYRKPRTSFDHMSSDSSCEDEDEDDKFHRR